MKYSIAFSVLAGTAMAAGAADTVNQVLNDINTAVKALDTAIKAYSGDAKALIDATGKIQTITEGGASKISSGPELTLNDAVSITTNVQGLQGSLDSTLSGLEGIGPKLASSGQCGTITSSLTAQGAAAKALQDAITLKAPVETKSIAQQLGGKIGASISNTQSKFTTICAGAKSGSAPSSGSAPASGSSGTTTPSPAAAKPAAAKPATSSGAPKPATYTGGSSRLTAGGALAIGAAILAL